MFSMRTAGQQSLCRGPGPSPPPSRPQGGPALKALGHPPPRKNWHFPDRICREVPDFLKFHHLFPDSVAIEIEKQSQVWQMRQQGAAPDHRVPWLHRHPHVPQAPRSHTSHELNASYFLPYTQEMFSWGKNSSNPLANCFTVLQHSLCSSYCRGFHRTKL